MDFSTSPLINGQPWFASGTITFNNITVTGQGLFADGTAPLPSISFASDPDTGIYHPALNQIGLVTNGTLAITIDSAQNATFAGFVNVAAASPVFWNARSQLKSPADGIVTVMNNAGTDFTRLQFGGTTAAFPALKRNLTALNFRLADDSADAPFTSGAATINGLILANAGVQVNAGQDMQLGRAKVPGATVQVGTIRVLDSAGTVVNLMYS